MVRFSEIAIKSTKTRKRFIDILVDHLQYILESKEIKKFEIIKGFSRIFISTTKPNLVNNVISSIVPGIASTSIVYQCKTEIEEIKKVVKYNFLGKIKEGSSFAVRAKRTGKHTFSSMELGAIIGEFILESKDENSLRVDLSNPEYLLSIEVRDDRTYIFDKTSKGLGGLPVGCQGTVLVLVSGSDEDISNIIRLYKRGANTLVYAVEPKDKIPDDFLITIEKLIALQPNLNNFIEKIHLDNTEIEIEKFLDFYTNNKCSGLGMSKEIFDKISDSIPVSIPVFIPHLVTEIDYKIMQSMKKFSS